MMSQKVNFRLMATYNQRMNRNVYQAAADLSTEKLVEDAGAFFKSILGTLNHILVGDTIWLQRFAGHPAAFQSLAYLKEMDSPASLDAELYSDLNQLRTAREQMDVAVIDFTEELTESDLSSLLDYRTTAGEPACKNLGHLVQHFFNHQTHHRGQVSTLLSQAGQDIGVTDLLALIPDETSAD